jgi:succinate dehydrogenase / fumarate reductase iron-sulfur subunit
MAAKSSDRGSGRTQIVPAGRIPVSEFAAEVQGGLSPFGEDVQLPLPAESLTYRHPTAEDRPNLTHDHDPDD